MIDSSPCRVNRASGRSWRLVILLVATGLSGCDPAPEPISIVPDSGKGRQAIEVAMTSWKAGHPTGIIEPTSPRVQVVDTHRQPGQSLLDFEILSDSADSRLRTFTLRLTLAESEDRPIVRFLVVGIDPILVFRQEDYDLLMHWEHRMVPEPEKSATVAAEEPSQ